MRCLCISSFIVHILDAKMSNGGDCGVEEFESVPPWVLLPAARECCPRAFDAVFKLDLYGGSDSDELNKVFDFPFWRLDHDVHTLNCHRVASSAR